MRKQTATTELQQKLSAWTEAINQRPPDSGTVVEYRCTLVTPMYGGGVQAGVVDTDMPIRATSIRGQLRHWWRFLYRQRYNAAHPDQPISSAALFAAERAIWGGLGDADTLARSVVSVAVSAAKPAPALRKHASHYRAARYALFPALSAGLDANLLKEGFEFRLTMIAPEAVVAQIQACVHWWAAFGGVGARTRRGLGAVKVRDSSGNLLPMPAEAEVAAVGCALTLVPYGDGRNPLPAWEAVVECLKQLRQGEGIARNPATLKGTPPRSIPGRSYWPEPDSIRRLIHQELRRGERAHAPDARKPIAFPRAMFGLPIITRFPIKDRGPDTDDDPQDTELLPKLPGEDQPATRLASPLLLRPMCRDGVWYAGALLMPLDAVRSMGLVLRKTNREKTVVARLDADAWWRNEFAAQVDPLNGHADPIAAYLDRLRAGGKPAGALVDAPPPPIAAVNEELTLHRPRLKRNNANGSLTIEPRDGQRPRVLIGAEAQHCFDALSASAQNHLRESRYPPFNCLTIIVAGTTFVSLEEYPQ